MEDSVTNRCMEDSVTNRCMEDSVTNRCMEDSVTNRCEEIVVLTASASCVLREKLSSESSRLGCVISGMRLSLRSGGCAGMSYEMSYVHSPLPGDIRQDIEDLTLYIDPLATMFLLGTVIDHRRDKLSSGFTFSSPRATASCGCGESVAFG